MEHLIICPSGAIPLYFNNDSEVKKIDNNNEEIILLKKRIRDLTNKLKQTEKERDAYKLYVPKELLTIAHLMVEKS